MNSLRSGEPGAERPGLPDGAGVIRDPSGLVADIDGATLGLDGPGGRRHRTIEALS